MARRSPVRGARLPLQGSRSFRFERRPGRRHQGVDLFAPRGTPVTAPAPGKVVRAHEDWAPGFSRYGSVVVLRTESPRRWHLFSHLDQVTVKKGQVVREGQQLGSVGSSAGTKANPKAQFRTSAPHLHWEVSPRPYPRPSQAPREDPLDWLKRAAEPPLGRDDAADPSKPDAPSEPQGAPYKHRRRRGGSAGGAMILLLGAVLLWATENE